VIADPRAAARLAAHEYVPRLTAAATALLGDAVTPKDIP